MAPARKSKPTKPSTEPLPTLPTAEEMETWDKKRVLRWIQQRDPFLLDDDDLKRFRAIGINGTLFLDLNYDFLHKNCGLSPPISQRLTRYLEEVLSGVVSPKGKRKREGESVAPESPTTKFPKRRRPEQRQEDDHHHDSNVDDRNNNSQSEYDILLHKELEYIRKRRENIKKIITDLDKEYSKQHSRSRRPAYSEFPLPGAVALLSDPERQHDLPFPITYMGTSSRFAVSQGVWRYVGREKFPELLRQLEFVRKEISYNELWVYGTRGYGKSHLLAALVCYLSALGECVIYIPDCRNWLRNPVAYFKAAMLFAFTDKAAQDRILTLETTKGINDFLGRYEHVHFVIDQMNALNAKAGDHENIRLAKISLSDWISCLISARKAVLSSSANNHDFLIQQNRQNYNHIMHVYGGLTKVCLHKE